VPTAAPPAETDVVRWSHDAVDAWDHGDVAKLGEALSPGYVHFEGGSLTGRDAQLALVAKRKGAPVLASRAWSNERIVIHEPFAVFLGEAKEHSAGNEVHGGDNFDGWYSLVWCREGSAWKIAFWSWRRAGTAAERAEWNDTFRNGTGFSKEPNQLLIDTVASVKPGTAIDVAMGQGRNALYLASRGWKVTGVDFSDDGIHAAREAAAAKHLALDTVNADLETYDFGVAKWDLVTMIYALDKIHWVERAKKSVKPGGLFVLEGFTRDEPEGDGYATGELAGLFKDDFDILRDEVVETTPDWAYDHAKIERFVARRRAPSAAGKTR
jgi:SAM-dependent methyltransferase